MADYSEGSPTRAHADNNVWASEEDLNGECFVSGELGEVEERRDERMVVFLAGDPMAEKPFDHVTYTAEQAVNFVAQNFKYVKRIDPTVSDKDAAQIAYLRFLAVRNGLVSNKFSENAYFAKYKEVKVLDVPEVVNAVDRAKIFSILSVKVRTMLRKNFVNLACCVAYMFRVRGHHWVEDMDSKYKQLWRKCLKESDTIGLEWRYIAHHSLHAVYPIILDDYWKMHTEGGTIAGALAKRFDCAPAGIAAIRAVYVGAKDLVTAIPQIGERFHTLLHDLDELIGNIRANRWAGSINRALYNAKALDFDEQKFGAIAAVVVSALNAFQASSPLLKSNALQRVASNAPLTGGIVSRGIATVASDPGVVRQLVFRSEGEIVSG